MSGNLHCVAPDGDDTQLPFSIERYRSIVENSVTGIFQSTPDGHYLLVNPALACMYGYDSPAELVASVQDISRSIYVDPSVRREFMALMERHGEVRHLEYQVRRKDGSLIWISEHARAIRDATGKVAYYEGFIQDITHQKCVEEQFLQAQKMEAVGRLASGVAHDFNNVLTAILGYAEILEQRAPDATLRGPAIEIRRNTERAAALCRQLLVFGRKSAFQHRVIDLNAVVTDMNQLLRRVMRVDVTLVTNLCENLRLIKADQTQLNQVLLNLAVNARDAMPGGGTLTLATANLHVDHQSRAGTPQLPEGDYVVLTAADTGCGMPPAVLARLFEPFFTTKAAGKGTGLGLATCYSIVSQCGGQISVTSQEHVGTIFKIYLPAAAVTTDLPMQSTKAELPPLPARAALLGTRGHETILLAEDEPAIRELTATTLRELGYQILEAADGQDAMRQAKRYGCKKIDLLVTDMSMPNMGGKELAYWLRAVSPKTRVLYTSGYADTTVIGNDLLNSSTRFLQKPFPLSTLAREVCSILDQ